MHANTFLPVMENNGNLLIELALKAFFIDYYIPKKKTGINLDDWSLDQKVFFSCFISL